MAVHVAPPINLMRALPPTPPEIGAGLARTLGALATADNLQTLLRQVPLGGSEADRAAGAAWVGRRLGSAPDVGRVLVTNGTQNTLNLLITALVGRGGLLLAEALTYTLVRPLAERLGVAVDGVAIDDNGLIPAALEEACQRLRPRALYCNPTIHNPTTSVMPTRRRLEIAEIARRHGVAILEDDVVGASEPDAPPPIAALAPDVTWYVQGLAKCIGQGLRVAYLVTPDEAAATRLLDPVRTLASWFGPSSLATAVVDRWIADGTAATVERAIHREAMLRQQIAARLLDGADVATRPGSLHLWLHLPAGWTRRAFVDAVARAGALVRPADLFAVGTGPIPEAVRISLTSALDLAEMEEGLSILAEVLGRPPR